MKADSPADKQADGVADIIIGEKKKHTSRGILLAPTRWLHS